MQANTPVFVLTFIDPGATLIRKEENDIGAKSLSLCSSQCYTKAASVLVWDTEVTEKSMNQMTNVHLLIHVRPFA